MSTSITRHPDGANLMSYAAGALPEPLAAAVAAHVALCPECRAELRALRGLGGALLDEESTRRHDPAIMGPTSSRLAEELTAVREVARGVHPTSDTLIPAAIASRYAFDPVRIPWRWLAPGVRFVPLVLSPGATGDLRLLQIAPGRKIPEHGHGGCEMTLVLDGAYSDETGVFRRGDIQDVDGDLEHQPVVDSRTGCICLVAAERPARFKGVFSRLLQPWTGM